MWHVFYRPIYGTVPRAYNGTFKPRVNKEALYSFFTFSTCVFKIIQCIIASRLDHQSGRASKTVFEILFTRVKTA